MAILVRNEDNGALTYRDNKIIKFLLLCETEEEDTDYYYTVDQQGYATLRWYYGNKINLKVPHYIDGHPVRYIDATCYNYNPNILSIEMDTNIVSIN